jgi:hypothetical protein
MYTLVLLLKSKGETIYEFFFKKGWK